MALLDVECLNGHIHEVVRAAADWQTTPPCPECGAATERIHLPPRTVWRVDPVVVFQAPDGSCRFPGDANGQSADYYRKLGYERIEVRGAAEMRHFERYMQKAEYAHALRRSERMAEVREAAEKERRSAMRDEMRHMTEKGRALAREAIRQSDAKPREYAKEGGFHSEIFSYTRGNRSESRDSSGRRRRD